LTWEGDLFRSYLLERKKKIREKGNKGKVQQGKELGLN